MTRSDSYSQTIKQGTHIQMVNLTHVETHYRIFLRGIHRAIDLQPINALELLHTVACEFLFMLLNGIKADGIDIFDGFGESMCSHIIGSSCLKLKRQTLESGLLPSHLVNHLTTTLIGRQFLKPFLLAIQHTDTRRTIHLMAAEGEKVTIHRLHIHLEMGCTLGTIHQDGDIMGMSRLDDLFHWIDRAQYIAHMGHTDDFGSRRDQRFQLIHTQNTIIGDGDMLDNDTPFHGLKLPRYDVGMMLHLSDDHLIASLHLRFAERLCHQVDGLRGASCKDNLLDLRGIDELAYFFACSLMQVSGLLGEVVHTTMHVGIHIEVLIAHGVEHIQRLLCGGRIVEIHQRLLIYLPRKNREVFAYFVDIVHTYLQSLQPSHLLSSPRKRFSTRWCKRSRRGSSFILSITSLIKAFCNSNLASLSEIPR